MHRDSAYFYWLSSHLHPVVGVTYVGGECRAEFPLASAAPQPGSGRGVPRATMAAAFSSDGEAALRRELRTAVAAAPRSDLDGFYEMGRAAAFVRDGGFRKVSGTEGGAGGGLRPPPLCRCFTGLLTLGG